MISTLIWKDFRLLRIYLRFLAGSIIACFVAPTVTNVLVARGGGELLNESVMLVSASLAGGSLLGLIAVVVFSALLSASVLTLERSDRSSQFLACLPPTRFQIYLSKLIVILGVVSFFLAICLLCWFLSNRLFHQGAATAGFDTKQMATSVSTSTTFYAMIFLTFAEAWDEASLWPFFAVIASMIGGSLFASLWSKSNAVPTLCGVLTPITIVFAIARVATVWDLDLPAEQWFQVFSFIASVVGVCCMVASGYIYLGQRDY